MSVIGLPIDILIRAYRYKILEPYFDDLKQMKVIEKKNYLDIKILLNLFPSEDPEQHLRSLFPNLLTLTKKMGSGILMKIRDVIRNFATFITQNSIMLINISLELMIQGTCSIY